MPSLSLRQQIILIQVSRVFMAAILCASLLNSYKKFNAHFVLLNHANDLGEIVLHIRQLEEGFLLGEVGVDYQKLKNSIGLAKKNLEKIKGERKRIKSQFLIQNMIQELDVYWGDLDALKASLVKGAASPAMFVGIKDRGEHLSLSMNTLVKAEQNHIQGVIEHIVWVLLALVVAELLMSIVVSAWFWKRVIMPLKAVAKATSEISQNTFVPFHAAGSRGEIYDVFTAFNKMSAELDKQRDILVESKKLSSIGTLAAGTAHQLNNPLNNISTSCQIAIEDFEEHDPKFMRKLLANIEQEVQRASETVKGLLEFSRMHHFDLRPVALKGVVDKVMRLVAGEVPAGISVHLEVPGEIMLLLDSQKMTEALLNLLTNGIQAINQKTGTISIIATPDAVAGQVVILVQDSGAGIAPENLRKIFDPFFTTKGEKNGTGLGLSVVYGIIKKHNGVILVESVPGHGSQFSITLPWPEYLRHDQEQEIN